MRSYITLLLSVLLITNFSWAALPKKEADIIVASDGSAEFTSIQTAIDKAPINRQQPFVIRIKPGKYEEKITIPADRPFVHLIGEDRDKTILTYGDYARKPQSNGKEMGTFATPSVSIKGDNFKAENLTIENSAGSGEKVGQAVALAVNADRAIFRNCRIVGHQDTLLANAGRQYYQNCRIEGGVDFIFGNATAAFDSCQIYSNAGGYLTAQSRTAADQTTGYVFNKCVVDADAGVKSVYLGRPWRPYARVVFLECQLGAHIHPAGWHNWKDPEKEKTAYYAEYNNVGPGAKTTERVPWSHQMTEEEAKPFQPLLFLRGKDQWNPTSDQTKRSK